jgi:DNA repair protein RadB
MNQLLINSGSAVFDKLLNGGYETDIITTIYGPAGSGKTLACLLCAISAARRGKVIYIDTEGGFSVERLKQLTRDYERVLENMFFLKPTTFAEQKKNFEKLKQLVSEKIVLIVVDSISMLYRLELKQEEAIHDVNRELAQQVAYLTEIARKKNIPVVITNQVYANFDDKNKINIVGGDVLRYGSKCLIELQVTPNNKRRAILRKHRSISERDILFEIKQEGMIESKESKGFRLF